MNSKQLIKVSFFLIIFALGIVNTIIPANAAQNDAGSGDDAGDTYDAALSISPGSYTGELNSSGDNNDYYSVSAVTSDIIAVSVSLEGTLDGSLHIRDPNNGIGNQNWTVSNNELSTEYMADEDGNWIILIARFSGEGNYSFTVNVTSSPPQNDAGSGIDAGNDFESATSISEGSYTADMFTNETHDFFNFSFTEGDEVLVTVFAPSTMNLNLHILDPDQFQMAGFVTGTEYLYAWHIAGMTGSWRLRFYRTSGYGSYSFNLTIMDPQNDAGSGEDAGNIFADAYFLYSGTYNGEIRYGEEFDYYCFPVGLGYDISITLNDPSTADFDLILYDEEEVEKASNTTTNDLSSLNFVADDYGTWSFLVSRISSNGTYSFTLTITGSDNDAGSGADAGDTFETAYGIMPGSYTGTLIQSDWDDYYYLNAIARSTITVNLTAREFDSHRIIIINPVGNQVATNNSLLSEKTLSYTVESTGSWRIQISRFIGAGNYSFNVSLTLPPPQDDAGSGSDAGDTIVEALAVTPGSYEGELLALDTNDYYGFIVDFGYIVNITFTANSSLDTYIYLVNPFESEVASNESSNDEKTLLYKTDASGPWFFRVHQDGGTGNYSFTINVTVYPPQNDAGSGTDAGDAFIVSLGITPGFYEGELLTFDPNDFYHFNVDIAYIINITVTDNSTLDSYLYLVNPSGTQVASNTSSNNEKTIIYKTDASGDWRLRIYQSLGIGNYSFILNVTATSPQNDAGSGYDAGDTFSGSLGISPGSYEGELLILDPNDYYHVTIDTGYIINVTLNENGALDSYLYIINPSGTQVASNTSSNNEKSIIYVVTSDGNWRIRIFQSSGLGNYSFIVTLTPPPPQDDAGSGSDAGNTFGTSLGVSPGSYEGELTTIDTDDYYHFTMGIGDNITIIVTDSSSQDYDVDLDNPIQQNMISNITTADVTIIKYTADIAGNWWVRIYRYSGEGNYSFSITVDLATQDDHGSGTDAGNTFNTALPITGGPLTGDLNLTDSDDYYSLDLDIYNDISITLTNPVNADFDLYIYDPTGQERVSNTSMNEVKTLNYTLNSTGEWRIRISRISGIGHYSFSIIITILPPQNDAGSGNDAGNTFNNAYGITEGSYSGLFYSIDMDDYYSINVGTNVNISVSLTDVSIFDELELYIYDPTEQLRTSNTSTTTVRSAFFVTDTAGNWRIRIYRGLGSGNYDFTVIITVILLQNDAGSGTDAGNTFNTAYGITDGSYTGTLDSTDSDDYYSINVGINENISVTLTDSAGDDYDLFIYDPAEQLQASNTSLTTVRTANYVSNTAGEWRIRIYQNSGIGNYAFTVTIIMIPVPVQNDAGSGTDASNTFNSAYGIIAGSYTGTLDSADSDDYYSFDVSTGDSISINVNLDPTVDYYIYLYNSTQVLKTSNLTNQNELSIPFKADSTGKWRFRITRISGIGEYNFTLGISTPASSSSQESSSSSSSSSLSTSPEISPSLELVIGIIAMISFSTFIHQKKRNE